MSDNQQSEQQQTPSDILPENPMQAIKALTDTVKELIVIMDREAHALATNDVLTLTSIEDEKDFLAIRYEKLATEFKNRTADFKAIDMMLIEQLGKLQNELAEKTASNMQTLDRLRQEKLIKGEIRPARDGELPQEEISEDGE